MSLNKCMIIGNLGRDPEMRYTPSGQAVTQFTVATNRNYRDQQGEWQKETEWFRIVVWGPQAERAAENLRKGGKVYIEGRIQTRQWEDQSGQKRYTTELVANQVTSLERREREDADFPPPDEPRSGGGQAPAQGGPSAQGGRAPTQGGPSAQGGQAPAQGSPSAQGGQGPSRPAPSGGEDYDDLPF